MGWNDIILGNLLLSKYKPELKCAQKWVHHGNPDEVNCTIILNQSWSVSQWLLLQCRVVCSGWVKVKRLVLDSELNKLFEQFITKLVTANCGITTKLT